MSYCCTDTRKARHLLSQQWSRETLNGFLLLVTSGASIGYATRPLSMVVTTPWLMGWSNLIDGWRLGFQVIFFTLTLLILIYCVSNDLTVILSNVLLRPSLAYYNYRVVVFGHTVALVMLVLDAIFAPVPVGAAGAQWLHPRQWFCLLQPRGICMLHMARGWPCVIHNDAC